jgi:ATP-dependent helicase HrpB
MAAALSLDELESHFANEIVVEDVVGWDDATRAVVARRRRRLGALVLGDSALAAPDPEAVTRAFLEGLRGMGVQGLPWTDRARRMRDRLRFLRRLDAAWPDVSDPALADGLEEWLRLHVVGLRRAADLAQLDLEALLLDRVPWERRALLDSWAPPHLQVPSGSRVAVDYTNPEAPVLAVRLQEMFGRAETPTVGNGRVPVTLHLLSPAGRPVQVTRDLAGFWRTTYFGVRKDLRGRYPRHHWPEDPLRAEPTRQARRRGRGGGT